MSGLLCTYRDRLTGIACARPEDDPVHPGPDERMGRGLHVWRHEPPKPQKARTRSEYQRGYDSGYHAGLRHGRHR